MMEVVAYGGDLAWINDEIPPSSTCTLAFGGLYVTCLAHDVTLGGLGLDGYDSIDGLMKEETWHDTLALDGLMYDLGRPNVPPCNLNIAFLELNVTLLGYDITLLGFRLM
jgi:hypothetical protein